MADEALRWAVFACYLTAFIVYCHVAAIGWQRRTNPQRVTLISTSDEILQNQIMSLSL